MILLDTDHVSILQIPEGQRTQQLKERLAAAGDSVVGTTIVTVEEQMRGWLAAIAKERQPKRHLSPKGRAARLSPSALTSPAPPARRETAMPRR